MIDQLDVFGAGPALPDGFRYRAELITADEEEGLLAEIGELPLEEFKFQGYVGRRRVISFGWKYDFSDNALHSSDSIPPFLLSVRSLAARFAGIAEDRLPHVLITEYGPGAGIGWHRDRGVFGEVIGISLLSSCTFRLRRRLGSRWERVSIEAAARSVYLISGLARTEWEHSIPPVDATRYSITFRTLRDESLPRPSRYL